MFVVLVVVVVVGESIPAPFFLIGEKKRKCAGEKKDEIFLSPFFSFGARTPRVVAALTQVKNMSMT